MLPLPAPPSANERALAGYTRERRTGLTGAALVLGAPSVPGTVLVWQNGALLDPATVGEAGDRLTLPAPADPSDVFTVTYYQRV